MIDLDSVRVFELRTRSPRLRLPMRHTIEAANLAEASDKARKQHMRIWHEPFRAISVEVVNPAASVSRG